MRWFHLKNLLIIASVGTLVAASYKHVKNTQIAILRMCGISGNVKKCELQKQLVAVFKCCNSLVFQYMGCAREIHYTASAWRYVCSAKSVFFHRSPFSRFFATSSGWVHPLWDTECLNNLTMWCWNFLKWRTLRSNDHISWIQGGLPQITLVSKLYAVEQFGKHLQ